LSETRFPLLSVRAGNPPQFTGPLARVLGPRVRDHALAKALGGLSRLSRGGERELFGMTAEVAPDGTFSARPTGPLGKLPEGKRAIEGVQKAVRGRGKPIIRRPHPNPLLKGEGARCSPNPTGRSPNPTGRSPNPTGCSPSPRGEGDVLIYTSYQPPIPSKPSMKLLGSRLAVEFEGHPQLTVCRAS
jgi:hypothetical protein